MTRTIFKGGTVISATEETMADLVVAEGRIAFVGEAEQEGQVVEVSGLLVLPGTVDSHVRLMDPGDTDREGFPTGTMAAAARGVTTIVEPSCPRLIPPARRPKSPTITGLAATHGTISFRVRN